MSSPTSPPRTDYTITHAIPSAPEYIRLRSIAGLTAPPESVDVKSALKNSIYCVIARYYQTNVEEGQPAIDPGKIVGMCRAVGDGHVFIYINDVCVDPEHQGKGLGRRLVRAMMEWLDEHAKSAYISLEADPPGVKLYREAGFEAVKGMAMSKGAWW